MDNERFSLINGDCMEEMAKMPENSVDAIVTDPPYGLAFMGAKWDSFGGSTGNQTTSERQAEGKRYAKENKGAPRYANSHGKKVTLNEMVNFQGAMTPIFEEAFRVAKPGAHLLCFGGTRTFHRMACAIESAGWEIRDTIMWVYGSGFPKSMDVGKAIDKALGVERDVVGHVTATPTQGFSKVKGVGTGAASLGDEVNRSYDLTKATSKQAKQWEGWGTCLKPAWEPIIVARKPLDGTVAHNVMTYGTGAINIDGCRVPTNDKLGGGMRGSNIAFDRPWMHDEEAQAAHVEVVKAHVKKAEELGRFPANIVHDGSSEVVELFPDSKSSNKTIPRKRTPQTTCYGTYNGDGDYYIVGRGDSGSAARFFYCAKASKKDRGEGNDHPTVKPTALMQWLVRLVCPQGGVVMDPFCGSGSTGVACAREGMRFIGMDTDPHYIEIAQKRLESE